MREKRFNIKLTTTELNFIIESMSLYVSQYSKFNIMDYCVFPEAFVDSKELADKISKNIRESRQKQLTPIQAQNEPESDCGWIY